MSSGGGRGGPRCIMAPLCDARPGEGPSWATSPSAYPRPVSCWGVGGLERRDCQEARFPAIFGGCRVEGYLCTGFWRVALFWLRFVRIWWRLGCWRRLRGPGTGQAAGAGGCFGVGGGCAEAGNRTMHSRPRLLGSGSGGRKQAPGVGDDERRRRVPLKSVGIEHEKTPAVAGVFSLAGFRRWVLRRRRPGLAPAGGSRGARGRRGPRP